MRINRLGKYRSRRKYKSALSWMFYILLPVLAMAVALLMSDTLKSNSLNILKNTAGNQAVVDTFSQVFNLEGKQLYRVEFKSFEDMPSAEKFVKTLKNGGLNAFILKEGGFKVIYGAFSTSENAVEISSMLEKKKKENKIAPVRLSGISLKYGDADKKFVELVKASDQLMDRVLKAKSQLSTEYALKSYTDYESKLNSIKNDESSLAKYLGDVKQIQVTEDLRIFREQYIKLLMDFQSSGIEPDAVKKDYYKLQNSMLLQIKSYRDFLERLSI